MENLYIFKEYIIYIIYIITTSCWGGGGFVYGTVNVISRLLSIDVKSNLRMFAAETIKEVGRM